MARDGSGTFNLAEAAFVNGSTIDADAVNSDLADIASGLTGSIAKDGQTVPTANLPMGTFKHTGVAAATARTDYARADQVIGSPLDYAIDTGSADAYAIAPSPGIVAYVAGQKFRFKVINANLTSTPTLAVNGLTAGAIKWPSGARLGAGDLPANAFVEVVVAAATPVFHLQTVARAGALSDIFFVDDHGAVADWNGSTGTDNTAAFAACYAAAKDAGGGIIQLGLSDYMCSTGDAFTVVDPGIRVQGPDVGLTSIVMNHATHRALVLGTGATISKVSFAGFLMKDGAVARTVSATPGAGAYMIEINGAGGACFCGESKIDSSGSGVLFTSTGDEGNFNLDELVITCNDTTQTAVGYDMFGAGLLCRAPWVQGAGDDDMTNTARPLAGVRWNGGTSNNRFDAGRIFHFMNGHLLAPSSGVISDNTITNTITEFCVNNGIAAIPSGSGVIRSFDYLGGRINSHGHEGVKTATGGGTPTIDGLNVLDARLYSNGHEAVLHTHGVNVHIRTQQGSGNSAASSGTYSFMKTGPSVSRWSLKDSVVGQTGGLGNTQKFALEIGDSNNSFEATDNNMENNINSLVGGTNAVSAISISSTGNTILDVPSRKISNNTGAYEFVATQGDFASDALAAAAGVPVGGTYRDGSVVKVRVS